MHLWVRVRPTATGELRYHQWTGDFAAVINAKTEEGTLYKKDLRWLRIDLIYGILSLTEYHFSRLEI